MSEYELRRVQARLARLEDEAEAYRRDHSFGSVPFQDGKTSADRAADVAREIKLANGRLRELLSAGDGDRAEA